MMPQPALWTAACWCQDSAKKTMLLDRTRAITVPVGLVGLVVSRVVLGLGHCELLTYEYAPLSCRRKTSEKGSRHFDQEPPPTSTVGSLTLSVLSAQGVFTGI
jgi:hypothetical protein